MAKIKLRTYDVANYLRTPAQRAAYLEACIEEANGETAFIVRALGNIARSQGMSGVARITGLSRESLYKALSGDTSPTFDTILKVTEALGIRFYAKVARTKGEGVRAKLAHA